MAGVQANCYYGTDWCKTCKQFDIRYRKVASSWGERWDPYSVEETEFGNLVRFAQMEYGGENCMTVMLC